MKRILHIAEAFGSGVFNYIKNLSEWQCKDYEVYIAFGIRPETPLDFKNQFSSKVHFKKVKGFTREISPINDITAFMNIKRIVKEIKPDIIHLHSTKAGVIGRWAVSCDKYQVWYSPHAYSFLMMDCNIFKRKIYMLIEKISDRKKCLTIADIDGEYEASKKVTKNAICIPNGINPEELDEIIDEASKKISKAEAQIVCMLGKIVPQKNPELFDKIAEKFPDTIFLWIGDGPLRDKLKSKNIIVTGWISRTEAMSRILSSDIFLFPSLWESLSMALMEVMYAGIPCVVSAVDGNSDIIVNGRNGYVCKNLQDYIDVISGLLNNSQDRRKLGHQAHRDIVEKYNVHAMEKRYRKLL